MNRALPPRDRGDRNRNRYGQSRSARIVYGAFGLVSGTAAHPKRGTPPNVNPAASRSGTRSGSGFDRVAAFSVLALRGLDVDTHFLPERARKKSAHRMRLPASRFHQFLSRRAAGAPQQIDNLGCLAAVSGGIGFLRALTRFGRFLGGGGLLPRLSLLRRTVRATCANTGAFRGLRLGRTGCLRRLRLFCDARHGFSLRGGHRVDDMDHSVRPRLQAKSERPGQRRWKRPGSGLPTQIASGCVRC